MTRVVAQVVYQLDVDEMPLKKLEKQQNKTQAARGRSRSNVADVSSNRRKTFSQGLLMKVNAGKSHPALHRSGSTKRERFLSGGSAMHTSTSHRSLNPAAKVTADSQLGDMSKEPLLVDSTVSLASMDHHSSTSSQQQQSLDGSGRRGSEPIPSVDHPLLSQTCSVPMTSSNTPSPLSTHSPLVSTEHKPPWAGNESPVLVGSTSTCVERQSPSAFVSTLQPNDNDFILTNEHADTPSIHDNSPSGSRRTSENTCTTPEPKKHMTKAFSVDDTRQRLLAGDSSSNRLLSSPDSFSSDILPDHRGSIKIRRIYGSGRREQPTVIHEEKAHASEGPAAGDYCIRVRPVRATIALYPIGRPVRATIITVSYRETC